MTNETRGMSARTFTQADAATVERTAKSLWKRGRDRISGHVGAIAADMHRVEAAVQYATSPGDFDEVPNFSFERMRLVDTRKRLDALARYFVAYFELFQDVDDREAGFVHSMIVETKCRVDWLESQLSALIEAQRTEGAGHDAR
jgi:hypothetical protein